MSDWSGYFALLVWGLLLLCSAWIGIGSRLERTRCPTCRRLWARELWQSELLGIFKKRADAGDHEFTRHEKYRRYYACIYCGYLWMAVEAKKMKG